MTPHRSRARGGGRGNGDRMWSRGGSRARRSSGSLGGLGGGIAGVAAATAYGAGELGEPVDVSDQIPDIDQPP